MSDEKILDLKTKKPFELVTGDPTQASSDQVIVMMERMLNYARERKYVGVAISMVDAENRSITAYHMDEGASTALAGAASHVVHRLHKHMDDE